MKRAATFGVYIALTAFVLSFGWQLRPRPTVITVGIAPRPEARLTAATGDGQYVEGGDCSGCKAADGEHDDDSQCVSNFCSDGSCTDCTKPEECLSNVCDVSTGVCKPPSQQDAPVCKCDSNRFEGEKVYCCTSRLVDFVRFEADAYKQKVLARYAGDVPGSDYWQAQEQRWQAVRREFTNSYSVLRDAANEYPQSPSQLPGYAGKTNKEAFDAFLNASPGDSQGCPHILCADCNVKYDSYFVYNEAVEPTGNSSSSSRSSSAVSSKRSSSSSRSSSPGTQNSSAGFTVEKTLKERRSGQSFVLPLPPKGSWETDGQACTRLANGIGNPELTCPSTLERNGQTYCACTATVAVFEVSVARTGPNAAWFHLVDMPGTSSMESWSAQKQTDLGADSCLDAAGNRIGDAARCRYVPWHSEKCEGQVLPQCAKQCVLNGFWQTCEPLRFETAYAPGGWGTDVLKATVELLEFAPCTENIAHYNEVRLYPLPYKEALIGNADRYAAKGDVLVPCEFSAAPSSSSVAASSVAETASSAPSPLSSAAALSSESALSSAPVFSSSAGVSSSSRSTHSSSSGKAFSSAARSSQNSSAAPVSWVARGTLGVGNALFGSIDATTVSTFFVMLLGTVAGWWWVRRR